MRYQTTLEYLLFVSGITVIALVIAAALLPTANYLGSSTKTRFQGATIPDLTPPVVDLNVEPLSGAPTTLFDVNCTTFDENLTSIEIYLDGVLLKRCTTSPCVLKRTLPLGTHRIDCVASDSANASRDFVFVEVS